MKKSYTLATLFLLIFIDSLNYFLIMPVLMRAFVENADRLLPPAVSLATRAELYGLGVMLAPLCFLLFSPFLGNLSDKYGRKKIMLGCLFAAFCGYALPIFGIWQKSLIWIFIGRALTGAAMGSQPIAQAAVTDISQGPQKSFYLALIGFAMTLGMMIGPFAGSYLSDPHFLEFLSISTPYYLGAFFALLNIVLLYLAFHETHVVKIQKKSAPILQSTKILFRILFNSNVSSLLFIFCFFEIAWSEYYQSLFLYFPKMFGYSADQIGNFTLYIGIWMCFGLSFFYKWLTKQIKIAEIFALSIVIMTGSLIILGFIPSIFVQWVFVAPLAVFTGTAYASMLSLLSDRADPEHQGWVLGVASFFMGLTWMITAFTSGKLMGISTQAPMIFAALSMLVAFGLFLFNRKSFTMSA